MRRETCNESTQSVSLAALANSTAALNSPSLLKATISEPLPTSKGRKKLKKSSSPVAETVLFIHPQSGVTLRLSPEEAIEESRKLALADFPASRFQSPVNALVSRMNAISSETCCEWLTRLDCKSSASKTSEGYSWVTAQQTLMGHMETFSGSWPRAGLLRDGYVYELRTLALPTEDCDGSASAGENWLTPNVMDSLDARSLESLNEYQERSRPGRTSAPTLREQVVYGENWGTPRSSDAEHGGPNMRDSSGAITALPAQVMQNWRTPVASDADSHGRTEGPRGYDNLHAQTQQWCTPSAENFRTRGGERSDEMGLDNQVKQEWSSPQARDYRSGTVARTQDGSSHQSDLNDEVVAWTTPCATDGHTVYLPRHAGAKGTQLNVHTEAVNCTPGAKENREQLNPAWEEILMGWPEGWTDASKPCTEVWQSWPAGQGPFQYAYEPPRTVPKGSCPNRVARVKMVGNGVCPQQAEMAYTLLLTGGK